MARLKKLLLLANQHITRFHKELAAKDEQLRVPQHVTRAVLAVPPSITLPSLGGLFRLLATLRTRGELPSSSGPNQRLLCGPGREGGILMRF